MNIKLLDRARKREKKARKEAEKLLESKSRELYNSMNKLAKANKELEESLLREKELSKLKSSFVTTASHQFRTPLAVIQSNAELLNMLNNTKQKVEPEKFKEVINRIRMAISKMTDMMDDVLALGKSTSGNIVYSPEIFNLVEFCEKIAQEFTAVQSDGRVLELQIKGDPYLAKLDVKLLTNSLSNLISNAFKFSKKNPLLILNFMPSKIQLAVKDYGIGIAEHEQSNLFHPFFRAENVTDIKGTGLGLSIAKEYIEINKGIITATSILGKGSCFKIIFKR